MSGYLTDPQTQRDWLAYAFNVDPSEWQVKFIPAIDLSRVVMGKAMTDATQDPVLRDGYYRYYRGLALGLIREVGND